jgi:hypothetical protein
MVEKHFEIAKKLMPRDLKYRIENSIGRYEKTGLYGNWNIK